MPFICVYESVRLYDDDDADDETFTASNNENFKIEWYPPIHSYFFFFFSFHSFPKHSVCDIGVCILHIWIWDDIVHGDFIIIMQTKLLYGNLFLMPLHFFLHHFFFVFYFTVSTNWFQVVLNLNNRKVFLFFRDFFFVIHVFNGKIDTILGIQGPFASHKDMLLIVARFGKWQWRKGNGIE